MPAWALGLMRRIATDKRTTLDRLWLEPSAVLAAGGMLADSWQAEVLGSHAERIILLCSRQVGKSTVAAACALKTALLEAPALVLVVSPSERQSGELMHKIRGFYAAMQQKASGQGGPGRVFSWYEKQTIEASKDDQWLQMPATVRESALQIHMANGSRIIGLPGSESTIRGYSGVSLLIVDEASRVADDLYRAVRPMLATSHGRLMALSTPFGKRGWFYEAWSGSETWHRLQLQATQCPRITAKFLAEERKSLGARWYAQEYGCSFEDVADAVFSYADIQAALVDDDDIMFAEAAGEPVNRIASVDAW